MDLHDKKVIVTGVASGIGAELVKLLLEYNCFVVGADIKITNINHPHFSFLKCDISKKAEIDSLFEFSIKIFGNIDVFIANAGIAYYENISNPNWEHIQNIFETNTIGVLYSAEKMKELNGYKAFRFVIMSSVMSFVPFPGYALYCGTKAALRGFANAYRWELGKAQKLHIVYPISTRTNFFTSAGAIDIPKPCQSANIVASRILSGIRNNKKEIYPSKLFLIGYILNNIFPFITKLAVYMQLKSFKKWIQKKSL